MHPSELKNRALVAANAALIDGFSATAQALLNIAIACAEEARNGRQADPILRPTDAFEPSLLLVSEGRRHMLLHG
jgi:hypothetical protein